LLGGLGQGIKLAGMDAGGYQIVAGTFRGAFYQDGGLDLDEAASVKEIAYELNNTVAQEEVLSHARPAQIEVAVLKADVLIHFDLFVDVEGRGFRWVKYLRFPDDDLDVTGGYPGVLGTGGAQRYLAGKADDVLGAHLAGGIQGGRGHGRVKDRLDDAFTVAQVNKDKPAVVTAAVDPAGQGNSGADVLFPERTAGVSPEQISLL